MKRRSFLKASGSVVGLSLASLSSGLVLGRSLGKTFGEDLKVRLVDEQLSELQEVDLTPPPEPPPPTP